jgi:adenylosuccinate synthase
VKRLGEIIECEGWSDTLSGDKLSKPLDRYLSLIEDYVGVKITLVGTGTDRKSLFEKNTLGDLWS